jgi:flagellin-specific chaperone FliS
VDVSNIINNNFHEHYKKASKLFKASANIITAFNFKKQPRILLKMCYILKELLQVLGHAHGQTGNSG